MIELSSPTVANRLPINLFILHSVIFAILCSYLTRVEGGFQFDPLIKLPHLVGSRNRTRSTTGVLYVNDYGAKGDGIHDDTKAFRDVWKAACSFSKKAKIVIPARNSYIVGPTNFGGPCSSDLTLKILGSIIAPEDPSVWDGLNPQKWLYFHGVNRLIVEGNGMVDGMGHEWWARSCKTNTTSPCQHAPTALTFHKCDNLKIRKLTMVNSQQMHIAFTSCVHVAVSHLNVVAPGSSPNTDGIHISSSSRVEVKDSIIRTGDDCISIVGNSSNIRMKNITCGPGHGISIGSLGKSKALVQVHDVRLDGAFLSDTENGVRIKTWQTSAVKVEDVSFVNIIGTSATKEAIKFACSENAPCERLYLEDIQLVSCSGGSTRSFCREAHGSWSGLIYPPPCLSCSKTNVVQKNVSGFVLQPIVNSTQPNTPVAVM